VFLTYDRLARSVFLTKDHGRYYLRGRWYFKGKPRVRNIESYGSPPALYRPIAVSGLAEDRLRAIPRGSFNLVYLDPPYGTTSGEWDRAPDWRELGAEVERILKEDGQVILHGMAAMAARCLVAFELVGLRHRFEIVWLKQSMPWSSDHHPLHAHEQIHVFAHRDAPTDAMRFNRKALGWLAEPYHRRQHTPPSHYSAMTTLGSVENESDGWRLPVDVIYCPPVRERPSLGHVARPHRIPQSGILACPDMGCDFRHTFLLRFSRKPTPWSLNAFRD
jgi:hypothetical protein